MKKMPKSLAAMVIVAVLVVILLMATSYKPKDTANEQQGGEVTQQEVGEAATESPYADVEPVEFPVASEVEKVAGFSPKQVDRLTDEFVIRNVETSDNKVSFYYQKHLATSGDRIILNVSRCSEEEYNNSLPTEKVESVALGDLTATYVKRLRYYLIDENSYNDVIDKLVKDNVVVVDYGNSLDEVSDLETLSWYQEGCKYELYVLNHNFGAEKIADMAEYYIQN